MDIEDEENKLQFRAKETLSELNLLEIVSKYGTLEIVGSVALGVMTRRDIDLEIIVEDFTKSDISSIIQSILQTQYPRIDFTIIDNTDTKSINLPVGFYLGIKYAGNKNLVEIYKDNPDVWQIDCWFLKEEYARGSTVTKEIKEMITPEKRKIILEIKSSLAKNPDFKRKFNSIDIYRAVLDSNILTEEEFINHQSSK